MYDVKIILGDICAKVEEEETFRWLTGPNSIHKKSHDNGNRTVSFTHSKNLPTSSTNFQHKRIHKHTWQSPHEITFNQTDHRLTNRKHGTDTHIWILRGRDCDTDHHLVCIKYKHRMPNIYMKKETKHAKFNTVILKTEENEKRRQNYEIK